MQKASKPPSFKASKLFKSVRAFAKALELHGFDSFKPQ